MRILLVEDEPSIADTLVYALTTERYEVEHALTGQEAIRRHQDRAFDFVILDIGLPDITGLEVCKKMREDSGVPILFLTARESELDRVLGLEIGGDDYVTKPFSPREIVARVRAILRRSDPERPLQDATAKSSTNGTNGKSTANGTTILSHDSNSMRILCSGEPLNLTAHEYKLLLVFIRQPGRVYTRDQLLEHAWEDPGSVTDRTIDAHIKTIRAKLREAEPGMEDLIQTRRGLGYAYVP